MWAAAVIRPTTTTTTSGNSRRNWTGAPAVGWCNFGQPGRALQDAAVGTDIWDLDTSMTVA